MGAAATAQCGGFGCQTGREDQRRQGRRRRRSGRECLELQMNHLQQLSGIVIYNLCPSQCVNKCEPTWLQEGFCEITQSWVRYVINRAATATAVTTTATCT